MVLAYLPVILKGSGVADGQIGIVIGSFSLASMLFMLPSGLLSDVISPKRITVLGACCLSVYFFSLTLAHSFYGYLVSVIIGGIGASVLLIVLSSLYLKIIPRSSISSYIALYQIGGYVGYSLGALAGGQITYLFSAKILLLTAGISSLVLVLLTFFLQDANPIGFPLKEYKHDLLNPGSLWLMLAVFVFATHFGVEQTTLALFMQEKLNFTLRNIGYMFAGIGAWMALLVSTLGYFGDYKNKAGWLFLSGFLLSSAFQSFTGLADSFGNLFAVRLLHTTGDSLALLGTGILTTILSSEGRLGGYSGLLYIMRTAATFSGAAVSGLLNTKFGYDMPFVANGVFGLAFCLILAVSFKKCCKEYKLPAGQNTPG